MADSGNHASGNDESKDLDGSEVAAEPAPWTSDSMDDLEIGRAHV